MDRLQRLPADDQYLRMKIQTASPAELIMIMYDGGVRFLNTALENYELHNRNLYDENLIRAKNVIRELQLSLNMEAKPIAGQLFSLYDYMNREISEAICNRQGDRMKIKKVVHMLQELRATWKQIKDKAPVEVEKEQLAKLTLSM